MQAEVDGNHESRPNLDEEPGNGGARDADMEDKARSARGYQTFVGGAEEVLQQTRYPGAREAPGSERGGNPQSAGMGERWKGDRVEGDAREEGCKDTGMEGDTWTRHGGDDVFAAGSSPGARR